MAYVGIILGLKQEHIGMEKPEVFIPGFRCGIPARVYVAVSGFGL